MDKLHFQTGITSISLCYNVMLDMMTSQFSNIGFHDIVFFYEIAS